MEAKIEEFLAYAGVAAILTLVLILPSLGA
jgi:hypothetical protein